MIGWSQMNERSHDMTLNRMLLDVSVLPKKTNHICGVMVQVLASSVVNRGFLWCKGSGACLECGKSWVQVPVVSNQRL